MALLDEVIRDCARSDADPANILRNLKIVAARLGTAQLEEWVDRELSGYDETDSLPPYRGPFPCEVMGEWMLPFAKSSATLPIAAVGFPKDPREGWMFKVAIFEPLSSVQALLAQLKAGDHGSAQVPWPADLIALTNSGIRAGTIRLYENAGLLAAWRPVTVGQLANVIDAVKSRALQVALDLERINPAAGERGETIPVSDVNVINQSFFGGTNYVSQGPNSVLTVGISAGDLQALFTALGLGSKEEQEQLETALREDGSEAGQPALGRRVLEWLAKQAGGSVLKVSVTVATQLLLDYLGLQK